VCIQSDEYQQIKAKPDVTCNIKLEIEINIQSDVKQAVK